MAVSSLMVVGVMVVGGESRSVRCAVWSSKAKDGERGADEVGTW